VQIFQKVLAEGAALTISIKDENLLDKMAAGIENHSKKRRQRK
jgi:hypothetical protein